MEAMRQSTGEQTNSQVAGLSKGLRRLLLLDALILLVVATVIYFERSSLKTVSEFEFSERTAFPHDIFSILSPDTKIIAAGSGSAHEINLRKTSNGEVLRHPPLDTSKSRIDFWNGVLFSPDNQFIAVSDIGMQHIYSEGSRIELFSVASGDLVCSIQLQHTASYFAISPYGDQVAVFEREWVSRAGSRERKVRVGFWGVPEGKRMFTLPIPEQSKIEPMFAYAPDGKLFAVVHSDGSISLWQLPDAKCIRMLREPNGPVSFVAFSPRGDIMASVHSRQTIALWRVSDGTLIDVIKSKFSIAQIVFSPDGALMAAHAKGKSRGESIIRVWRVPESRLVASRVWHNWDVRSLAFSADNKLLAVGVLTGRRGLPWYLYVEAMLDKIFRRQPPGPSMDHCGCFTYTFSMQKMRIRGSR
jgi:WD40 repeat protein